MRNLSAAGAALAVVFALCLIPSASCEERPPLEALRMAATANTAISVTDAALAASKILHSGLQPKQYTSQLDALVADLKPALSGAATPEAKLRVMAERVYQNWGFGRQAVAPADVYTGLDDVIDKKRWNCFGMSLLYLSLGERVGIPLRMVAGRGHALVQWNGPEPLFVETTQSGRVYPSKDYLKTYLPFPCVNPADYTALDTRQALAVIVLQTALAFQNQKQFETARASYEVALQFDPRQSEALTGLGIVLLGEGKRDDALALFRKVVSADPTSREALGGLGETLHAKGDLSGALQAYRKLAELCATEPKAQFNLGQVLYESNDLDGSVAAYRKYVALSPNDADGYARLAFPLEDKGDLEGAAAAYRKALSLNPGFVDARINLGHVLEKQHNAKDAEASYRAALALQSRNPLALSGLGRALTLQKRFDEAIANLRTASEIDAANAGIWIDYGNALAKSGAAAKAIDCYRRAIDRDPTDPEAYLALAESQLVIGATADAKLPR